MASWSVFRLQSLILGPSHTSIWSSVRLLSTAAKTTNSVPKESLKIGVDLIPCKDHHQYVLEWKLHAGSSQESSKEECGSSHAIKHALFLGNDKQSGLKLTRELELIGAQLWIEADHEYLTIRSTCPKDLRQLNSWLSAIVSMVSGFQPGSLQRHQMLDLESRLSLDRQLMDGHHVDHLWRLTFAQAFAAGWGNDYSSCLTPAPPVLESFWNSCLQKTTRLSLLGVESSSLGLLKKFNSGRSASDHAVSAKYHGGQLLVCKKNIDNHGILAFPTNGRRDQEEHAVLLILQALNNRIPTFCRSFKNSSADPFVLEHRSYSHHGLVGLVFQNDFSEASVRAKLNKIRSLTVDQQTLTAIKNRVLVDQHQDNSSFALLRQKDNEATANAVKSITLSKLKSVCLFVWNSSRRFQIAFLAQSRPPLLPWDAV